MGFGDNLNRVDENEKGERKTQFPILKNIQSIGENKRSKDLEFGDGWKRFFENEKYQMMYNIKDFSTSGFSIDVPTPNPDIFKGTEAEDVAKRNPELFKLRKFSAPGAMARAGLYALFDIEASKKSENQGKNSTYENIGGLVSVSDLPNGFGELMRSDFPEDAKTLIIEHFQKQL